MIKPSVHENIHANKIEDSILIWIHMIMKLKFQFILDQAASSSLNFQS